MNLPFQEKLVSIIKEQVPQNVSLPMELSQLLGISPDSAYRRLRCETAFSLDETVVVCRHFEVPLESLNELVASIVSFRFNPLGKDRTEFLGYLKNFLGQISTIAHFEDREVFYAAEDIPLFHLYSLKRLTSFKFFYWQKTILSFELLQNQKFSEEVGDNEMIEMAQKAAQFYAEVPSTEIWTEETISSTLKQIKFYWEAGMFENMDQALLLLEELRLLVRNLHRQCDLGLKIRPGGAVTSTPFVCYHSDLMIGNNCVLVKTNGKNTSFLGYNTFNFMSTGNRNFNSQNQQWMENLISKSTQISSTAEKLRNQFFKGLNRKIDEIQRFIELE